jgi:ferredoxin-NADP reductase
MLPESFECTVEQVRTESPDTATLVLDTHGHHAYRAGQYLSIGPHQFRQLAGFITWLEHEKGKKEPQRKYSIASAPHERHVEITVKEEAYVPGLTKYPPLLSHLLVRGLTAGASFTAFGYSGPYVLPETVKGQLVVHVVAGTGAAPNFSLLKDALHRGLDARHVWIASNKRREDILYRAPLEALERAHEGQLTVIDTLTRESAEGMRSGRVSADLLHELIPSGERATCLVYACGPAVHPWERKAALESDSEVTPRFMETVLGHLHALGIDDRRIKRETWG